jgi:predicted TIM-barrel enzyme
MFASRFKRPLFGMVHLAPLPGAPRFGGTSIKRDGRVDGPVDAARVACLAAAFRWSGGL